MLAALKCQLDWLLGLSPGDFGPGERQAEVDLLKNQIDEIEAKGTDKDVAGTMMNIIGDRIGYMTKASGYWDEFVPKALECLQEEFEDQLDDDESSAEDRGAKLLARVRALRKRKNTQTESYISEFHDIMGEYGQMRC